MATGKWMVFARRPQNPSLAWEYASNYFPRAFHYKSDANRVASLAKVKGGSGVFVKPFLQKEFDQEARLCQHRKTQAEAGEDYVNLVGADAEMVRKILDTNRPEGKRIRHE